MSLLDKPGSVYVVANPAWPGWVKVGHCVGARKRADLSVQRRLGQFNVADPHKSFELVSNFHAACCLTAEQFAHELLEVHHLRGKGEWFRCSPEEAARLVEAACDIARLRPESRQYHFERELAEERSRVSEPQQNDDTVKILKEIADLEDPKRREDVAHTARAASAVIRDLLEMMAMPCENTEAAAAAVLRRLGDDS